MVYHYTSFAAALKILLPVGQLGSAADLSAEEQLQELFELPPEKRLLRLYPGSRYIYLRASRIDDLNDATEFSHGLGILKEIVHRDYLECDFRTFFDRITEEPEAVSFLNTLRRFCYVSSFSEMRNDLTQWRLYGGNGLGLSIGFDREALAELFQGSDRSHFDKVMYDRNKIISAFKDSLGQLVTTYQDRTHARFDTKNSSIKNFQSLIPDLVAIVTLLWNILLVKNEVFASEIEYRLQFNPFLSNYLSVLVRDNIHYQEAIRKFHDIGSEAIIRNDKLSFFRNIGLPISCIREIWIGPRNMTTVDDLTQRLIQLGHDKIEVQKSVLPFR